MFKLIFASLAVERHWETIGAVFFHVPLGICYRLMAFVVISPQAVFIFHKKCLQKDVHVYYYGYCVRRNYKQSIFSIRKCSSNNSNGAMDRIAKHITNVPNHTHTQAFGMNTLKWCTQSIRLIILSPCNVLFLSFRYVSDHILKIFWDASSENVVHVSSSSSIGIKISVDCRWQKRHQTVKKMFAMFSINTWARFWMNIHKSFNKWNNENNISRIKRDRETEKETDRWIKLKKERERTSRTFGS